MVRGACTRILRGQSLPLRLPQNRQAVTSEGRPIEKHLPDPNPLHVDLHGADLSGKQLRSDPLGETHGPLHPRTAGLPFFPGLMRAICARNASQMQPQQNRALQTRQVAHAPHDTRRLTVRLLAKNTDGQVERCALNCLFVVSDSL